MDKEKNIFDKLMDRRIQQDRLKNNINVLLNQLDKLTDSEIEKLNKVLEKRLFPEIDLEESNKMSDKLFENQGSERE